MALVEYYGTGRRKTSTARVHIRQGSGQITVNKRPLDEYFGNDVLKMIIKQPLALTETNDKFDIVVTVDGGGPSGQAGAIRHGISSALQIYNTELRTFPGVIWAKTVYASSRPMAEFTVAEDVRRNPQVKF